MATRLRFLLPVALIPVVGLVPWQRESHSHGRMTTQDVNWTALTGSMERMHAAMASTYSTGNRDVDFVTLMLPHHQGAVDMAKAELLYGENAQIRRLAQEIITDQESEIQLMQLWLKQHGASSHVPRLTPGVNAGKEQ